MSIAYGTLRERTNPVVGLTYAPDEHRDTPPGNDYDRAHFLPSEQGSNRIYFSSKGEEFFIADRIYERALESDVVLVLPSQIHGQVCEWAIGWESSRAIA